MTEAIRITVNDRGLRCQHCGHEQFLQRAVMLDRSGFANMLVDAQDHCITYVCGKCGFVHFFMRVKGVEHHAGEETVRRDDACLSCRNPIPVDAVKCPTCGWTWRNEEVEGA